ncbi:hypothetical protein EDD66_102450 [Mobilisporobacter senegalensis]|uniref:Uncharacterized protein n=1 Tax=Mobilisporobacter senegalensis TaxID=1329262 RepID=A0A3N1XVY8_9FIRM|nr:hypothetical protein [Mobilisporobacter senegalensis]ROR30795.1 hypothetical protein EDD66_102450 [Mobilisporobacter senegalensis]
MPISRLDMISMAPKSQEVTQYKQGEASKTFAEHVQIQSGFQKEVIHNSQQAVKSTKSENKEKRYDAKEKGSNSYEGQGTKKEKKESKDKTEIKLSNFDIKI